MSNHPPNDNNGISGGIGGDWRQHQPRAQGSRDNNHVQPPPAARDALLPPPLPQQNHIPGYHTQAMLRQQALSHVSVNQPQQRQNVHQASNLNGANQQGINISSTLEVNLMNNVQSRAGVEIGMALDPEEQLGGDDNVLAPDAFHTSISGWSEVDASGGGIPPSARSLHSAALLNGVMYIFGMSILSISLHFQWIFLYRY
jgi:hypothetical protein